MLDQRPVKLALSFKEMSVSNRFRYWDREKQSYGCNISTFRTSGLLIHDKIHSYEILERCKNCKASNAVVELACVHIRHYLHGGILMKNEIPGGIL